MGLTHPVDDAIIGTTVAAAVTYTWARHFVPYHLALSVAVFALPVTAPFGIALVAGTRATLNGSGRALADATIGEPLP